jgi:hypothetical protein
MPISLKRHRPAVTAAAALVGLVAVSIATSSWFAQRPPQEVRPLDAVLRRLSQGNDLGQGLLLGQRRGGELVHHPQTRTGPR